MSGASVSGAGGVNRAAVEPRGRPGVAFVGRAFVLPVMASLLTACSVVGGLFGPDYVPDDPGLYAYANEELLRLDGDREWEIETWGERSMLDPRVVFVLKHPALENADRPLHEVVILEKVAWVRSEITETGEIRPVEGAQWVVSNVQELRVPLAFELNGSYPDQVRAQSKRPLAPGLYSLRLRLASGSLGARFGVAWSALDKQAYSARTCVDRYGGRRTSYRLCTAQPQVLTTHRLKLYLAATETLRREDGVSLVVNGVIVNTSDRQQHVPTLEANLRGADGKVLKRWVFSTQTADIAPGESAPFQTVIRNPPADTQEVFVRFTP